MMRKDSRRARHDHHPCRMLASRNDYRNPAPGVRPGCGRRRQTCAPASSATATGDSSETAAPVWKMADLHVRCRPHRKGHRGCAAPAGPGQQRCPHPQTTTTQRQGENKMIRIFPKCRTPGVHRVVSRGARLALLAVTAMAWSLLSQTPPLSSPAHYTYHTPAPAGWGASAIRKIHYSFAACSPIAAANACGMGASSCFKCHASGRGPAISKSPWHSDHEQVNNDCVGCHQGSPWILKKSLAHAGMIANPLTVPEKSCATCHQGANISKLVASYTKLSTPTHK